MISQKKFLQTTSIKKISLDFNKKKLLDFLSRNDRKKYFNKKNSKKIAILIYILVPNFIILEHIFFMTKLLFYNSRFFANCNYIFLQNLFFQKINI